MTFKETLSVWKSVLAEDFCTDVETQTEITIIDGEGEIVISVCLFCIWQLPEYSVSFFP